MDTLSILSAISSTITIVGFAKNFAKKFIDSLGMETSPELENQVFEAIEDFKNAQQDNNDLLISSLKEIPQFAGMRKEHLQTQFENTLKEFSNSNVVQLKDSSGNIIIQNHGGTINLPDLSELGRLSEITDANAKKQEEEKLFKFVKQLIIEFLELIDSEEKRKLLCGEYCIHLYLQTLGGFF